MKFPVRIYKGDAEYTVHDEETFEFHTLQGWSLDKPEPVAVPGPSLSEIETMQAEIAAMRREVASFTELVKGQGAVIARLQNELNKVTAALGINAKVGKKGA